jgi:uncharacterized membrane protein YbhN (UPF0104 family)
MRNHASTASFVLFVIVLLAALYWVLHQQGRPQWGLVAILIGILALRVGLFFYNLQQQKKRLERGAGASIPKVHQRLGLDDTEEDAERKRNDPQ